MRGAYSLIRRREAARKFNQLGSKDAPIGPGDKLICDKGAGELYLEFSGGGRRKLTGKSRVSTGALDEMQCKRLDPMSFGLIATAVARTHGLEAPTVEFNGSMHHVESDAIMTAEFIPA